MTNEKEFDGKRSGEISDAAMEQAAGGVSSSGHMEGNKYIVALGDPVCIYFVCATCKKPLAPYFVPHGDADRYCQCQNSYIHCRDCQYVTISANPTTALPCSIAAINYRCSKLPL